MIHSTLQQFLPAMQTLSTERPLGKQDLLTASFCLETENNLSMYYAPHNEMVNTNARIVIAGITPGWQQMRIAFETFMQTFTANQSLEACLIAAKQAAGFAGTMRRNLLSMLDECGIPNALNINQAADLFGSSRQLLHTTSAIKYPVFQNEKNYTGHQPPINRSDLLAYYAYQVFPEELAQIKNPALVIPLGKAADRVMTKLQQEGHSPYHTFLTNFPHPSGANGHRRKQFQQHKDQLQAKVQMWSRPCHLYNDDIQ